MLTIYPPEITERDGETVLSSKFTCGDVEDTLWFSTPKEFGNYLCHERGDAFLVALLLYAMKRGEDIHVLAPVSARLYYTLTKHFVKAVADMFPGYSPVQITCTTDAGLLENAGGVGTGLSCGIDSFCTVIEHTGTSCQPDFRLTHVTFFNVGASGDFGGDRSRDLFHERADVVRPCADELGLPLVTLDSNISEILDMDFLETSTFRNVAAALALQKLFKIYYYSSSVNLSHFEVNHKSSQHYDIFSLDMLSTETLKFFSTGEMYSRVEKTAIVSAFPLSHRYLNVCCTADTNCSRCLKCQRTLVTLDVLGKLDLYRNVFDLDDYRKNRLEYFGRILSGRKSDVLKQEIYETIQRNHVHIPFGARVWQYPLAIFPYGIGYFISSLRKPQEKR